MSSYWLWLRRSLVSWARAVPMLSATLLGSLLFAGPMLAVTLFGGMLVLLVETLDAMSRLLHKSIVRWCTVTNEEAQASPRIDDSWNIGFESCYGEMQVWFQNLREWEVGCDVCCDGPHAISRIFSLEPWRDLARHRPNAVLLSFRFQLSSKTDETAHLAVGKMKRENLRPRSNIASVRPTPGIEPRSHSLQSDGETNYATAPHHNHFMHPCIRAFVSASPV